MKKIGIMGGAFDPPHRGHLSLAERVRDALNLDEIWFIPTGKIPHKSTKETAPAKDRLAMTRLAVSENPFFRVDAIEVEREGYSYTYETLETLKKEYPGFAFVLLVGADSLDYMEQWREPERIFAACSVAAVGRKGFSCEEMELKKRELEMRYNGEIILVPMDYVDISSTEIRKRIREERAIDDLVAVSVAEYIQRHKLYQERNKDNPQ